MYLIIYDYITLYDFSFVYIVYFVKYFLVSTRVVK